MPNPKNAYLAKIQAQAQQKAAVKSEAQVELDTIAMLLAAHDVFQAGPGRAPDLVNSFLNYKVEIAGEVLKELKEDKSKQKEVVLVKRDLAVLLQQILGPEGWAQYRTLFPFLREFW